MRLIDLEPAFLRYAIEGGKESYHLVNTVFEADGIRFLCPKCLEEKGTSSGVHGILCWFRGKVPDSAGPKPGRWDVIGGRWYSDLSLLPSILLTAGCGWHGYIRNGTIETCP